MRPQAQKTPCRGMLVGGLDHSLRSNNQALASAKRPAPAAAPKGVWGAPCLPYARKGMLANPRRLGVCGQAPRDALKLKNKNRHSLRAGSAREASLGSGCA